MRSRLLTLLIIILLVACNNLNRQDKLQKETPKALQDKSERIEVSSFRSYDDLVESLYNELLEKNQELKNLEVQIQNLNNGRSDSTKQYQEYNSKNGSYYNAANQHIDQIRDSSLKVKMKTLISNSLTNYNSLITKHETLIKVIDSLNISIKDLHQVLKIASTLPLMENYQVNNLPSTKPLEKYIQKQEEVIKQTDSLSKEK